MPKQKTHKGLSKRVRVTATGRIKHRRTGGGHLMSSKTAKRRRKIGSAVLMNESFVPTSLVKLGK